MGPHYPLSSCHKLREVSLGVGVRTVGGGGAGSQELVDSEHHLQQSSQ